jgi:23S rRNA pseudouridine1911/1915/1917 synthase
VGRRQFVIPDDLAGVRADRALAALAEVSRSAARGAIDAGDVRCDGEPVRAADRLPAGGLLTASFAEARGALEPDPAVEFDVAYEDRHLIVVDKPAGLVVHPGSGRNHATLANGLIDRYPDLRDLGVEHRWGIVHRLDRDTSGLLIVARSDDAHQMLQDALRERSIKRRYLALVAGTFGNVRGTVDAPIGRDPDNPTRMAVTAGGKRAVTHYRRLADWPGESLLRVDLETGRTHQIRVHLRAIDHPVIGDPVYGGVATSAGDPGRPFLHAAYLSFDHPIEERRVVFESGLPRDLDAALSELGEPARGDIVADLGLDQE